MTGKERLPSNKVRYDSVCVCQRPSDVNPDNFALPQLALAPPYQILARGALARNLGCVPFIVSAYRPINRWHRHRHPVETLVLVGRHIVGLTG
ncbi:hypothetical protein CONPUDRAFT_81258 [Coniophora puteana RWD-64-598 SS2]|uniref:Uncharacterized protein n=1 Tax=Coniophora puteana (strain RWD-64-598) TaxID=741705 RepID=A0A5M3MVP8_CONPW|nr:uncharacterized protein CONPUDRAFT_81258 [Coniophora puteana RWD-64-598 SS2]EIW83238.1 hypothetical protein CONPUDRAFT_81258 [Coniophora puteana RWD-64-598 SS2]